MMRLATFLAGLSGWTLGPEMAWSQTVSAQLVFHNYGHLADVWQGFECQAGE